MLIRESRLENHQNFSDVLHDFLHKTAYNIKVRVFKYVENIDLFTVYLMTLSVCRLYSVGC